MRLRKAVLLASALLLLGAAARAGGWRQVGPGGADVLSLAVDSRSATLWAGTSGGGVYKSVDGGASWVFTGSAGLVVQAIAVDPSSPGTVYAAGDWDSNPDNVTIWKTTDGGVSWIPSNSGLTIGDGEDAFHVGVLTLEMDPFVSTTLYAGTWYGGVRKSIDGGASWLRTGLDGQGGSFVRAIGVDATRPGTVYASQSWAGIFKTEDGGATWKPANVGLGVAPGHAYNVTGLVIDSSDSQTLYAGTSEAGVYKSTDGAGTWHPAGSTGLSTVVSLTATNGSLWAGMTDHPCFTECAGLFRSDDGGATWARSDTGLEGVLVNAMAGHPVLSDFVYAGTSGPGNGGRQGVYRSTDGGTTWTASSTGLTTRTVFDVAVTPAAPERILAAAGEVVQSEDGGQTWPTSLADPGQGGIRVIAAHPTDSARLVAGGEDGLYVSGDGGVSWQRPLDGFWTAAAFDEAHADTIVAGSSGNASDVVGRITRSTDAGLTWHDSYFFRDVDDGAKVIVIDPTAPQRVYVATRLSGLLRSLDGGQTFVQASQGLTSGCCAPDVASLALAPAEPATLYAGNSAGVFKSVDGADGWHATGLVLAPEASEVVWSLAVDPERASTVYAGLGGNFYFPGPPGGGRRVMRSIDGGRTWRQLVDGFPHLGVAVVALDPVDPRRMYAGTWGAGLWVLDQALCREDGDCRAEDRCATSKCDPARGDAASDGCVELHPEAYELAHCRLDSLAPPGCAGEGLPAGWVRGLARASATIERARTLCGARALHRLARGASLLRRLDRRVERWRRHGRIEGACAYALDEAVRQARAAIKGLKPTSCASEEPAR